MADFYNEDGYGYDEYRDDPPSEDVDRDAPRVRYSRSQITLAQTDTYRTRYASSNRSYSDAASAPQPAPRAQNGTAGSHSTSRSSRKPIPRKLLPWLRLAGLVLGVAGIIAIIVLGVSLGKANSSNVDLQTQNSILDARNSFLESKNAQYEAAATAAAATSVTTTATSATTAATGVEDPWVASGTFTTGNAELDADVKSFCDYLSDPDASASDNAYTVYLHVSWYDYVERDDNQNPQGPDWAVTYALQLYNEDGGNCYEFVAFCSFCLQYFGYDAVAQPCFIEQESGSWGDHGLVLVTVDGASYICDLAKSSNGWMLPGDYYTYQIQDIGQGNI